MKLLLAVIDVVWDALDVLDWFLLCWPLVLALCVEDRILKESKMRRRWE